MFRLESGLIIIWLAVCACWDVFLVYRKYKKQGSGSPHRKPSFNVRKHTLFYRSHTESVLTFSIVCWSGNLSVRHRNKLTQVDNQASKIIGDEQLQNLITKKAIQVYNESTHSHRSSFCSILSVLLCCQIAEDKFPLYVNVMDRVLFSLFSLISSNYFISAIMLSICLCVWCHITFE